MTDTAHHFGTATVHDILARYSFYDGRLDEFQRLPVKNRNESARVSIGDKSWVIKRYPTGAQPGNLLRAHWFQLQMQEAGVPVARLVLTSDGKTSFSAGKDSYAVQEWVDGRLIDYTAEAISAGVIEALAVNLARMHQAGRELYQQHAAPVSTSNPLRVPANYVARIHRSRLLQVPRMVLLELKPIKTKLDHWVIATHRRLAPKALQIAEADASGLTDYCYLHNDMYWGNFVFGPGDELRAFIDFDKVEVGSWLYEVGCAASLCASSANNIRHFVNSYEQAAGSSLDRDALVLAMYAKTMRSSLWCVHAYINRKVSNRKWLAGWGAHLQRGLESIEEFTFER